MLNQSVTDILPFELTVTPLVIDAVYTFAHALLTDSCQLPIQWVRVNQSCVGQTREFNGSALVKYIAKVDFINNVTCNRIVFDSQKNAKKIYEILNYQASRPVGWREYAFVRAGIWDASLINDSNSTTLLLNNSQTLQFDDDNSVNAVPKKSNCRRCEVGQHRRVVQLLCCGLCLGQTYSTDPMSLNCTMCLGETWCNNPLLGSNYCQ